MWVAFIKSFRNRRKVISFHFGFSMKHSKKKQIHREKKTEEQSRDYTDPRVCKKDTEHFAQHPLCTGLGCGREEGNGAVDLGLREGARERACGECWGQGELEVGEGWEAQLGTEGESAVSSR